MTMIDLGEVALDPAPPAVPVNVPRVRRAVLAGLALLGSLVLTGAAPPAPPTVRTLWTTPLDNGESVSLSGDTAFLNRMTDRGGAEVAAYDLATGRLRWAAPTGETLAGFTPLVTANRVLVATEVVNLAETRPEQSRYIMYARATIALDATTGAERWRVAGDFNTGMDDSTGLVTEYDDAGQLIRLLLVRLSDGHELWSRPLTGLASWSTIYQDDQPTGIVTVTASGELRIYGYDDGKLRRSARVPWDPERSELFTAGPYLALRHSRANRASTTLYRPGDLRALWHTDDELGYVTGCDRLLCTIDGGGVAGRDPQTGQEVWRHPGMQGLRALGPGRLLLDDGRGGPDGTHQVVEAGSGRPVGEPGVGTPMWNRSKGSILVMQRSEAPVGRYAVRRLDVSTGARTLLGTIAPLGDAGCLGTERYLACTNYGTLTVTAVG
ncbi:outer membrane protein assembly factor BamB family protein [Paractinoplanes rishiriensis]|uniref:Pyrrolo-quinoline quinone repeat domain-containing protein n=1 Tax=Paractinoplanes rishiriensis TaxID=1050105 RepID=A0A919MZI6_9ACTN|nr:PQQ-binding-like beta-propeller repeat protein [Actinoplanes rishiriensis]GIE93847.1 hypothetical protein Ari01nite_13120 [Actinoplanes rishiriensis]